VGLALFRKCYGIRKLVVGLITTQRLDILKERSRLK